MLAVSKEWKNPSIKGIFMALCKIFLKYHYIWRQNMICCENNNKLNEDDKYESEHWSISQEDQNLTWLEKIIVNSWMPWEVLNNSQSVHLVQQFNTFLNPSIKIHCLGLKCSHYEKKKDFKADSVLWPVSEQKCHLGRIVNVQDYPPSRWFKSGSNCDVELPHWGSWDNWRHWTRGTRWSGNRPEEEGST